MKFLAIGDIMAADHINALLDFDLESYSFLILTGDMSGSPEGWKIGRARALNDKNFIPEDENPKEYYNKLLSPSINKLKSVDENLSKIQKYIKVFAVYGNTDFKSVVERVKPKNFTVVHNKIIEVNGMFLVGYNGHPMYLWEIENPFKRDIFGYTYAETSKELNSFKEDEIYNDLKALTQNIPNNRVIVVTHTPPYEILDKVRTDLVEWAIKSYGKKSKKGNVGSSGLKSFIIEYKPILSVFGHIHEAKGIKKIDGCTCINTGKFDEEYIHIEIKNGNVKAEFRRITHGRL